MFPQRKYIPDEYRENCAFQSWGGVKVVPGLAEGRGVFSTKNFSRGSFICNYGGLNHSSVHPNVEPKIYLSEWNKLDILFRAKRKIEEGEEIVWDYGSNFSGVNKCVSSCIKRLKKRTNYEQ